MEHKNEENILSENVQTIRQSLVEDPFMLNTFALLFELPKDIKTARDKLASTEFAVAGFDVVARTKEELEIIEGEILFEVSEEIDETTKKKKYGNETQRKAAFKKATQGHAQYEQALAKYRDAEQQKLQLLFAVTEAKNQVAFMVDRMKGCIATATMIAGLSHEDTTRGRMESLEHRERQVTNREKNVANTIAVAARELSHV